MESGDFHGEHRGIETAGNLCESPRTAGRLAQRHPGKQSSRKKRQPIWERGKKLPPPLLPPIKQSRKRCIEH
jgi:hypothetical protein